MKRQFVILAILCLAALVSLNASTANGERSIVLENERLGLRFDEKTGSLTTLENKLTNEIYRVTGDEFAVEAVGLRFKQSESELLSLESGEEELQARFQSDGITVEVTYTLRGENNFSEKRIAITNNQAYGIRSITLSQPKFSNENLKIIEYRYPKFERPPGTEPLCTFFCRTANGGFFTGVETPFSASRVTGKQVFLEYAPSLKAEAGEELQCEPVYLGVYKRHSSEREQEGLPLQSESDAMVSMTSTILGPRRHGLVPMACGWHSEMEQCTYTSEELSEGDMRSLDFLAECGIDWITDSHPWGGETEKMNALVGDEQYIPGPLVRKFLEHAKELDVKVVMWPTMNNTHPWWKLNGKPFRPDKPSWLMTRNPKEGESPLLSRNKANCLANKPFQGWLTRINLQGLATNYYQSWCMDGSFFGDGGWYTSVVPVDCSSDAHDHLPGDSNYASQRALNQLIAKVREHFPDIYIVACRPPMDLGVWSLKNVDACFTLLESGTENSNIIGGDRIRSWSRVRLHHNFFPHYLDLPLLFPSRSDAENIPPNWPTGNLDYILLSALSCSPNQLYYMPTKTGIPEEDKAQIRKWLDWGRKNITYLKVRKDLPDWPSEGKIDGSVHVVDDRGFVFLFNSDEDQLEGRFSLTKDCLGLTQKGMFRISQDYPASDRSVTVSHGETVNWTIPGESTVVLKIQPIDR